MAPFSVNVFRFFTHYGKPKPQKPLLPPPAEDPEAAVEEEDEEEEENPLHELIDEEEAKEEEDEDEEATIICDVCGAPKPLSRCFLDSIGCTHVFCLDCLSRHVKKDAAADADDGVAKCPVPRCLDGFVKLSTPATLFCSICMERNPLPDCFFGVTGCDHVFCASCIALYVAAKVGENSVEIRCPEAECREGWLSPEECRAVLPAEVFERWGRALCEASVAAPARFYCPYSDCSALLVKEEEGATRMRESQCLHCGRLCCAKCRVPWHEGLTCKAYMKQKEELEETRELKKTAEKCRWQRCSKCGFYVDRIDGCVYMRCRCGHTFCYLCGSTIRDHKNHRCDKCKLTWGTGGTIRRRPWK